MPRRLNGRPSKIAFHRGFRRQLQNASPFQSVLDVGCADGKNRPIFDGRKYWGVDLNERSIVTAGKRYRADEACRFTVGDVLDDRSLPQAEFDLVLCTHTLAHIDAHAKQQALDNMARRVTRDGHMILQCTSADWTRVSPGDSGLSVLKRHSYRGALSRGYEAYLKNTFNDPKVSTLNGLKSRKGGRYISRGTKELAWMLANLDWVGRKDHELVLMKKDH